MNYFLLKSKLEEKHILNKIRKIVLLDVISIFNICKNRAIIDSFLHNIRKQYSNLCYINIIINNNNTIKYTQISISVSDRILKNIF